MRFITTLLLLFNFNTFADTYFLETPVVNTEKPKAMKDALFLLTKQALVSEGETLVSTKKDANLILEMSYLEIDETVLLMLSLKGDGKNKMNKVKINDSSEIDIAVSRLVKATINRDDTKDSIGVDSILGSDQSANTLRVPTRTSYLFGFGSGYSKTFNDETGISYMFGYKWALDPQFDLQVIFDATTSSGQTNHSSGGLAVGARYFAWTQKHSPFVSAYFGYGSNEVSNHSPGEDTLESGLYYGLGLGYEFYRTSEVNLSVEAGYRYFTQSSKDLSPHATNLRLIVAF